MLSEKQFENFDYIIFSLMLSISSGIVADREMGSLPVSISLFASYISSASVFGGPLEAYNHGIMFIWCVLGYRICTFITSKIFIPLFVELGYTSAYEYLEKRFDKKVKLLATLIFILHTVLYLSFVLYSPAYAINGVTRMNTWVLVVTIGIVSTFYTTIGGMVTVMWTDVFQVTVIFFGLICIATLGLKEAGGLERVIEINWIYKRLNLFNFKLNLMERHTVWSLTLGYSIQWLSIYSVNQSQVQRYLSSKSLKVAKRLEIIIIKNPFKKAMYSKFQFFISIYANSNNL
ncbi:unnamed protein product [Brachionus calyciflorus]|uniref:Uncharacterized protein n=1 Tax=Brachionus calyciflorus TaxID=104777 RepID=A0A813TY33_9BILA|nr:unnamed protein product [Brachionus calyciflorus]